MRSSTTGGSGTRSLVGQISGSEGVRSPREEALVRGGTLGGMSRQRPSPTEANREPLPSRARWVLLMAPPRKPLSGLGEPAGEEPPSSLPESRWDSGSRRLSLAENPGSNGVEKRSLMNKWEVHLDIFLINIHAGGNSDSS